MSSNSLSAFESGPSTLLSMINKLEHNTRGATYQLGLRYLQAIPPPNSKEVRDQEGSPEVSQVFFVAHYLSTSMTPIGIDSFESAKGPEVQNQREYRQCPEPCEGS